MKKFFLSLSIVTLLLSGCTLFQRDKSVEEAEEVKIPTKHELEEMHNDLISNAKILEQDELIKVGDLGLDEKLDNVQNHPNKRDSNILRKFNNNENKNNFKALHHNWKYPQLHQTFINPKVKPINGSYVNNVVGKAWDYYGTPYQYGSDRNNPTTFDCSDFVRWVHLWTLGMDLPKTSSSQHEYVKKFSKRYYTDLSQAKRGDVLFFMSYKGWQPQDYKGINVKAQPIAHNGIYLGDGLIIHTASQKTGGVRFDKIKGSHLEYRFVGGGQVIQ